MCAQVDTVDVAEGPSCQKAVSNQLRGWQWNLSVICFSQKTLGCAQNVCTLQQFCFSCSEKYCRVVVNHWLWIRSHPLAAVVLHMVQPLLELETKEYTWYATNGVANVFGFLALQPEKQDSHLLSPRTVCDTLGTSCPCEGKNPTICHGVIHETLARHLWRAFSLCSQGTSWRNKPRIKTKWRTTGDHCLLQVKLADLCFSCDSPKSHFRWFKIKNGQYSTKLGIFDSVINLPRFFFLTLFNPWSSSSLTDWKETWIQSKKWISC